MLSRLLNSFRANWTREHARILGICTGEPVNRGLFDELKRVDDRLLLDMGYERNQDVAKLI